MNKSRRDEYITVVDPCADVDEAAKLSALQSIESTGDYTHAYEFHVCTLSDEELVVPITLLSKGEIDISNVEEGRLVFTAISKACHAKSYEDITKRSFLGESNVDILRAAYRISRAVHRGITYQPEDADSVTTKIMSAGRHQSQRFH